MRRVQALFILATLAFPATASAGPKEDAQARAALELSIALQKQPTIRVAVPRPDYATAYAAAMRDGKPLLIHVAGFSCGAACKESAAHACDAAEVFGDATPRLILAKPDAGRLLFVREWKAAPKSETIKAAVAACCPTGR